MNPRPSIGRRSVRRDAVQRRIPRQDRSREKVEAILGAARELIGARGNDAVSMREIVQHAGVPISTVYQYFEDKNAILRRLMQDSLSGIVGKLARVLDGVRSTQDLARALDAMVDVMVSAFRDDREFPVIWAAVQANAVLSELDAADGKAIAELLTSRLVLLVPDADARAVRGAVLYSVHAIGTTMRVAVLYSEPGDRELLIEEQKTLLRVRLESILRGSSTPGRRPLPDVSRPADHERAAKRGARKRG